jgi:hypothetical protein
MGSYTEVLMPKLPEAHWDSDPSTTEDDASVSSSDPDDEAFWASSGIDWDSVLRDQQFEELQKGEILRPDDPRLRRNQPPRRVKKVNNADWEYVVYIPEWTDPDFDESFVLVDNDDGTTEKLARYGDHWWRSRPSQLLVDEIRAPTQFARRWGIHPEELGGRSRISPSESETRRALLNSIQPTPSGHNKNYVDMSDLKAAHSAFILQQMGNSSQCSFSDALAEQVQAAGPGVEVAAALQSLLAKVEDDKLWQRYIFNAFSTDDKLPCRVLGIL